MGAVNTTYTFQANDTITSTKMNNIIDQTIFTDEAVFDNTLIVTSGKLKVRAQGITSNELATSSVTSNALATSSVTSNALATSSVTQAKLGENVVGNGPCFKATGGSNAIVSGTATRLTLGTISFDTNNNLSGNRFTPTVAGYYQFNARVSATSISLFLLNCYIYKNGAIEIIGSVSDTNIYTSVASGILYLNGVGDYVELYTRHSTAGTHGITGFLDGVLIRSA